MNIVLKSRKISYEKDSSERVLQLIDRKSTPLTYRADAVLFLDGDPAEMVYRVVHGVVRCMNVAEDGRKHIVNFACAGSLIGADFDEAWRFTAEAVGDVRIRAMQRSAFLRAVAADPALSEWRMQHVQELLREREAQLLTFASCGADARLMHFLAEFATTAGADLRRGGGATALPMSRRDIADHLGVSFETVSRAFSTLKRRGLLEMIGPGVFRLPDRSPVPEVAGVL
ncbi:MAG: Crp/Fnr family transcriptional regulator [Pseudomonadota bacterium]